MMCKKDIILFVSIFCVLALISGSTFAYWGWESDENKSVVFNTSHGIEDYFVYDEGDSHFVGDFQPTANYCSSMSNTISFYKTNEVVLQTFTATINMDVNYIGDNTRNSDSVYWLITSGDSSSCTGNLSDALHYGTFNGIANGTTVILETDIEVTTSPKTYTIWIWINSAGSSLSSLSGETIDVNIWTQVDMTEGVSSSGDDGNGPTLDSGMIPVKLSSDGTVTTVLSSDSTWYNYDNKEWANVVLVNDDSRDTYQNTTGITVDQSNILAYYVWIPRYKYKIWTLEESSTGDEQTIDIVFEGKNDSMSLGTQVGEYRTHSAFWWDDNSNGTVDSGETVAGIWVGKFVTSANTNSTCYSSETASNCLNVSPRIVPNVKSLRYQKVSTQFTTSQKFSASSNIYGLSNTSTNAHMMKNSEWGAVAYLSHSKYGINDEIRINNNNSFTTGCGASTVNGSSTSACEISYNSSSTPQSTTGNITGVFDMSGGAWEYVMGVLADSNGNPRSGNDSSYNSGYNGLLYDDTSYTSGISFPAAKYYDLYTGTGPLDSCNGGICYGHALSETANWYEDYAYFVFSDLPWFLRGGYYSNGANAGALYSSHNSADANIYYSWRSVLVVGYGA